MLNRILAGAPSRKTRLHDEKGNRITGSRLIRNGPRALLTGLSRVVLDRRPERPWISYDAQAALDSFLRPDSCVLEFGSGMSTIWYARRARKVVSIENHEAWYAIVQKMFRDNNISNVDYRHAGSKEAYLEFPHECYDLIMVDGRWRDECVEAALPYLAPGGMIYLDNSDKSSNPVTGDISAWRGSHRAVRPRPWRQHRTFHRFRAHPDVCRAGAAGKDPGGEQPLGRSVDDRIACPHIL